MINLDENVYCEKVWTWSSFTKGPPAMEQTEDGNLGVENSNDEEIVGRRKFSEELVADGWIDGVRERPYFES